MIKAVAAPNIGEDAIRCSVCGIRHKVLIDIYEEEDELAGAVLFVGKNCIE